MRSLPFLLLSCAFALCWCIKVDQDNHDEHLVNGQEQLDNDDYVIKDHDDLSIEAEHRHRKKRGKKFERSKHEKDHIAFFDAKTHKKNHVLPYELTHDE